MRAAYYSSDFQSMKKNTWNGGNHIWPSPIELREKQSGKTGKDLKIHDEWIKNSEDLIYSHLKVCSQSVLIPYSPSLVLREWWFIKQNITLSRIKLTSNIQPLPTKLHYLWKFIIVSLVLIAYVVTCLLQARIFYRMLNLAEVTSIAFLLKISTCNAIFGVQSYLFQKVKNYLGVSEERTWSLLAFAKFNFGFMQTLHSSWLSSNEKASQLSVTLKKIRWWSQTKKSEEEA